MNNELIIYTARAFINAAVLDVTKIFSDRQLNLLLHGKK